MEPSFGGASAVLALDWGRTNNYLEVPLKIRSALVGLVLTVAVFAGLVTPAAANDVDGFHNAQYNPALSGGLRMHQTTAVAKTSNLNGTVFIPVRWERLDRTLMQGPLYQFINESGLSFGGGLYCSFAQVYTAGGRTYYHWYKGNPELAPDCYMGYPQPVWRNSQDVSVQPGV